MGKRKPTKQQLRNELVLKRLIEFSNDGNNDGAIFIAELLDDILDEMAAEDFFGTEQQMDPRGDFRNKSWSMDRVEGVDK